MEQINVVENEPYEDKNIDLDNFFREVIGVTVSERQRGRNIIFFVDKLNAPYVKTKPFSSFAGGGGRKDGGTVFKICVQFNLRTGTITAWVWRFVKSNSAGTFKAENDSKV
jgi:hypothetical protein